MRETIVLIGAGSVRFARGIVADLIFRGWDAEIASVDIDPYVVSIGPTGLLPGVARNERVEELVQGHPPGCNWIFHPGKDGFVPSMRALEFREGLIDCSLLDILGKKEPNLAQSLTERLIPCFETTEETRYCTTRPTRRSCEHWTNEGCPIIPGRRSRRERS